MAKFHIVDTDLEVIDSGDNMLALRISCADVNDRFYSADNECIVMSTDALNKAKVLKEQTDKKLEVLQDFDKSLGSFVD